MGQKYAYQGSMENAAKAFGRRLPISTRHGVEICKAIKGNTVDRARGVLEAAINKEEPIKFTRSTEGAGHKKGMGGGKYPVKACTKILDVLNSAEANAQHQGLSTDLVVEHACAHEASRNMKYGRHLGREEKATHIEIVVKERTAGKTEEVDESVEDKEESEDEGTDEVDTDEEPETVEDESVDIPSESEVRGLTKDEMKEFASDEFGIELSTNDLKDEMVEQFMEELEEEYGDKK